MTKLNQAIVASMLLVVAGGCNSGEDMSKDNGKMRETMTSHKPFDINNVPAQYRDKVMQMRGGGGASKPKEAAPEAGTSPGPAPSTGQ